MNALQGFFAKEGTSLVPYRGRTAYAMGAEFRAAVRTRPFLLYMAFVATLVCVYYLLLAAPLYVSETKVAVRSKQPVAAVPLLASFIGQSSTGLPDATALENYIESPDILNALEKKHHLRALYSKFRFDMFRHMPAGAAPEDFLAFYNSMLAVDVDTDTNIITIDVSSFDPRSAQSIATDIVKLGSAFVDNMSTQMRDESVRAAQIDVTNAQAAMAKTNKQITLYRLSSAVMDPDVNTAANAQAVGAMQGQIYALRTTLASLQTYSTAGSPQVKQVQAQIDSLQRQISDVQSHTVGNGDQKTLAHQIVQYNQLVANQTYEQQLLLATQAALDQAESVANQKQMFVVNITYPNLPVRSTGPRTLFGIFGALMIAATVYGIAKLAVASIRDHQS